MSSEAMSSTQAGQGEFASPQHQTKFTQNVSDLERLASLAGGTFLIFMGLRSRSLMGLGAAGIGVSLVTRGVSGHCEGYRALGISTAESRERFRGVKLTAEVTINKPVDEVYRRYRDFSQHPQFSTAIKSVEKQGEFYLWTIRGPLDTNIQWQTRIAEERPGEMCTWRSTDNSDIRTAGTVEFKSLGDNRTDMRVQMSFEPPMGVIGHGLASALSGLPEGWAQTDLTRFKEWVETGKVASGNAPQAGHENRKSTAGHAGMGGAGHKAGTTEGPSQGSPSQGGPSQGAVADKGHA